MSAGGYEQVPGTGQDSYYGIDPNGYTGQSANSLYGDVGQSMINQGMGASNAFTLSGDDPGSFTNMFMQDFSQLGKGITDETSGLSKQLEAQQAQSIQQGMADAGGQMANLGSLRSSGMGEAAGDVVGRAATDASAELANAQLGLLDSYGNNLMNQKGSAYGQMMQQPGQVLGYQTQFGSPSYGQNQVAATPGGFDKWMQGLSASGDFLSGVGSIIPF